MDEVLCGNRSPSPDETEPMVSAGNFQSYIFELFEKNGVLNDLRAHLRGSIVSVLKNACNEICGDVNPIQKQVTRRLEYYSQSINMLIVDYLMNLNFNYTLSVFVSELPLGSMLNNFKQHLQKLDADKNISNFQLQDSDVYNILNYLGMQLDAETVGKLFEMYKTENLPLIVCLFKVVMMYKDFSSEKASSVESNTASFKSKNNSRSTSPNPSKFSRSGSPLIGHSGINSRSSSPKNKCRHFKFCSTCQDKYTRLQNKYKQRKESTSNKKKQDLSDNVYSSLIANMTVIERNIIDEIFKQLKSVYENEVETVKTEEQNKIKRLIAVYATQLKMKQKEMEETYREKEEALESNMVQKKRFLWGLARSLRDQHRQLAGAMRTLGEQDRRLADREKSLKSSLIEAERCIRERGECIKSRISEELMIVTGHLHAVRQEKESLDNEKSKFQHLIDAHKSNFDLQEDVKSRYMRIENELLTLKAYLESKKDGRGCAVTNSTTNTEVNDPAENIYLNNEQAVGKSNNNVSKNDEGLSNGTKLKHGQVVNDLKKRKNVNFVQSTVENSGRSHTSVDTLITENESYSEFIYLLDDHNQLKITSKQQQKQIEELKNENSRLERALRAAAARRPATAAAAARPEPFYVTLQRETGSALIRRSGGGEELVVFGRSEPRLVVPGDTLPFVGVVAPARPTRHLLQQWRSLRKDNNRTIKATLESISSPHSARIKEYMQPGTTTAKLVIKLPELTCDTRKSSKKLRKKMSSPPRKREKSPSEVLKEAKIRLKKLEIEAEAVEMSYLKYKRKHEQKYDQKTSNYDNKLLTNSDVNKQIVKSENQYAHKIKDTSNKENRPITIPNNTLRDISLDDKNKGKEAKKNKNDYLDRPLAEFRKLYAKHDDTSSDDVVRRHEHASNSVEVKSGNISSEISDKQPKLPKPILTSVVTSDKEEESSSVPERKEKSIDSEKIPPSPQDLLVYVESTSQTHHISDTDSLNNQTEMTIITIPHTAKISLKNNSESTDDAKRTPEVEANITRNDVLEAIYNDTINVSKENSPPNDAIDIPYYRPMSDDDVSVGANSNSIQEDTPASPTLLYNQLRKDPFWY